MVSAVLWIKSSSRGYCIVCLLTNETTQEMSRDQHNSSSVRAFFHEAEHNSHHGCQDLLLFCLSDSTFSSWAKDTFLSCIVCDYLQLSFQRIVNLTKCNMLHKGNFCHFQTFKLISKLTVLCDIAVWLLLCYHDKFSKPKLMAVWLKDSIFKWKLS